MNSFKKFVTRDFIIGYMERNHGEHGRISPGGDEFIMSSPFMEDDWKKKFSMNLTTGLWQCFRTHESGNFVQFFAFDNNIPYYLAKHRLLVLNFDQIGLEEPEPAPENNTESENLIEEEFEDISYSTLEDFDSFDALKKEAVGYLLSRNLYKDENSKYFLCRSGRFENRIIIPYMYGDEMYYFQARTIPGYEGFPKYLNPSSKTGAKSSEILYPYDDQADYLVVTEGPIDAITLQNNGVNATCTQGSHISNTQMQELSDFRGKVIVSYDNDPAGKDGLRSFNRLRRKFRIPPFSIVNPPDKYKDWNEAHVDSFDIKKFIVENSNLYDEYYELKDKLSGL